MHYSAFLQLFAFVGFANGISTPNCSAENRLWAANQIIVAYAANPGQSYAEFDKISFGVPNKAGGCVTSIAANGLCPVPVFETGAGVVQFGTETRQAFSSVTGRFVDFPQNLTTVINTNVTLGIASLIPIPVTFNADVYLDFNVNCQIYQVRAVAWVPSNVLGLLFKRIKLPVPTTACNSLPVKRAGIDDSGRSQPVEFVA